MSYSYSEQPRVKSWATTTYTVNEWTTLLNGATTLESLVLCNTSDDNIDIELRLAGAVIYQATVFPKMPWIEALPSIPVNAGDSLEMRVGAAGLHVTIGGSV